MALDFLAALRGNATAPSEAAQRGPRLATIHSSYGGSGAARVTFDGESTAGLRSYVALAPVAIGQRVVMLPVGHTFAILGPLDGSLDTTITALKVGYRQVGEVRFTATGTFTKASYPYLRAVKVRAVGSGGGGGGAATTSAGQWASGGGGGAGGYSESFITNIAGLASSVSVTIGSAGTAGAAGANAGGNGGACSFGALVVANGGDGGGGGTAGTVMHGANGGDGGAAGTGDIAVRGAAGSCAPGSSGQVVTAGGGGAALGGQLATRSATTTGAGGAAAAGFGNGGRGGANAASQGTARGGGAGAAGIVIIELYA